MDAAKPCNYIFILFQSNICSLTSALLIYNNFFLKSKLFECVGFVSKVAHKINISV